MRVLNEKELKRVSGAGAFDAAFNKASDIYSRVILPFKFGEWIGHTISKLAG
ncbi:hypothetical protein J0B02_08160 [Enterobacteriaceae bacterium YMB-R22]|jgi:hypothetical protein|uniref:hypothetical protein n=1 Tax=Tenebrionicola larvae TaxID=2815733 RepID=UPI0020125F7D|nr:hypothetical protein [Tenebrionicola larvae]MBV4412791.1 hypothetical protein [Tenebrionicola larvae]